MLNSPIWKFQRNKSLIKDFGCFYRGFFIYDSFILVLVKKVSLVNETFLASKVRQELMRLDFAISKRIN